MSSTRPNSRRALDSHGLVDSTAFVSDDLDASPVRSARRSRNSSGENRQEAEFVEKSRSAKRNRSERPLTSVVSDTDDDQDDSEASEPPLKKHRVGGRRSERSTRHQGDMNEVDIDQPTRDFDTEPVEVVKPRAPAVIRVFQVLPDYDEFAMRHAKMCEACGSDNSEKPFVYCQGCSFTYHQSCLGPEASREHVLTQVTNNEWVLQCKRCVGAARKRQSHAPDLGECVTCGEHGAACRPFVQHSSGTAHNNQPPPAANNAQHVLARCWSCFRAWHAEHQSTSTSDPLRRWQCAECLAAPAKIASLLAWKPFDEDDYDDSFDYNRIEEKEKLYLVKWQGLSHLHCSWMPGTWIWSIAARATLTAFAKNESLRQPKRSIEDVVPEDYTRADIILDVVYNSKPGLSDGQAEFEDVQHALVKFKTLGYEDTVWDQPPDPDTARYADFVHAYNSFLVSRNMRQPRPVDVRSRSREARQQDFSSMAKQQQPHLVVGGLLMQYQLDGMNWLYFQWHSQHNAILGDEMGLGKTIQIIAFLSTLIEDWTCFPHLIVVPNSTCENWLREIRRWAPKLRVVAYYGSKVSRKLSYDYELYPDECHDLRAHIVVTSYEAASAPDEEGQRLLHTTAWQSLVVDEGQRLKNDQSMLYASLSKVKSPFKVLMTGTPLQNNQRELFNLLQFLDKTAKAARLEERYSELDEAKIQELHALIKPYFLRRTKAEVLGFLPPMSQIIVPVSMSFLQKETYCRILSKNVNLVKALVKVNPKVKQSDSINLNNILMQLRKCLCHPFVYSRDIEASSSDPSVTHRNLVEASSKLKMLQSMLPKLKAAGHRVLIFSQFLDMLDIVEDFLRGMNLSYQRLDGQISSIEKQSRLDQFNAPDSNLFAFLLSTRAGGVGINLATADTVIILDPDFNPHQDMQALSRAHRIGQTKKVLCLQLVTKDSVEERIMQIGRKKLALDKALIQDIDDSSPLQEDLLTILRHGAAKLLKDEAGTDADIAYDDASVDALLDRSQIENAPVQTDSKSMWSFARVWTNNKKSAEQQNVIEFEDKQTSAYREDWDSILASRERAASKAALQKASAFGRGRRAKASVNYGLSDGFDEHDVELNTAKPARKAKSKAEVSDESDEEFRESDSGVESGREKTVKDAKKTSKVQPHKTGGKAVSFTQRSPTTAKKSVLATLARVAKRGKQGGLSLAGFQIKSGWATKQIKKPTNTKPTAGSKGKPKPESKAASSTVTAGSKTAEPKIAAESGETGLKHTAAADNQQTIQPILHPMGGTEIEAEAGAGPQAEAQAEAQADGQAEGEAGTAVKVAEPLSDDA